MERVITAKLIDLYVILWTKLRLDNNYSLVSLIQDVDYLNISSRLKDNIG